MVRQSSNAHLWKILPYDCAAIKPNMYSYWRLLLKVMVPNFWKSPLGNQTAPFVSTLWHSCVKWNYSLGCKVCTVIYSIAWMRKTSPIYAINLQNQSAKNIVVWNRLRSHIFLKLIWGFGIGVDFLCLLILYFLHSSISTILHFWKP